MRHSNSMNHPPLKVALFGGTFDPPHLGHIEMAREAVRVLCIDKVYFIPCRRSPHKTEQPPTSGALRMEMLRLAIDDIDWAIADDTELASAAPSYSVRTAESFASKLPPCRLFWLMGTDQWNSLPEWRQPERLAALVEFIVAWRGEQPPAPRAGYRFHPLPFAHPASASEIRDSVAAGEIIHNWLHPAVAAFIENHALYRSPTQA